MVKNRSKHSNTNKVVRYASIMPRFCGYFIDHIILGVLMGIIVGAYGMFSGNDLMIEDSVLILVIVSLVYYSLFVSSRWQATPGMRMIGLSVSTEDHHKLNLLLSAVRYILYLVNLSIVSLIVLFCGKMLITNILINNTQSEEILEFGKNGDLQADIIEMTTQIDMQTLFIIFTVGLLAKAFLMALPMMLTKKKQMLYDYVGKIVVTNK
jgi:uncharacterized RDD family membrane protein YckC